jgi:hypothetical protein
MKQRACPVFRDQRTLFALRFTCEHCTYFAVDSERCSHGYPNGAHRLARYASSPPAAETAEMELVFCKDFELF